MPIPDDSVQGWSYAPWQVEASDEEDNRTGGDHEDTPAVTELDAQGRVYKGVVTPDGSTDHTTTLELDILGSVLTVTDPRGNAIQVRRYDLLGRPAFTGAADEGYDGTSGDGETTAFFAVDGQAIRTWRSGGLTLRRTFDALRRPVGLYADEGSGERLVERTFYGDALSDATGFTQGQPVRIYDTAGEVALDHDFRGRVTEQSRTVIDDITTEADWSGLDSKTSLAGIDAWLTSSGGLDSETFTVTTAYDALDRVTEQTAPDSSKTVPSYDEGGRLTAVDVHVRGASAATSFVTEITYNARGQREKIVYGNHTSTAYTYDEDRFWLTRLLTERASTSSHGAATLQDLGYARDLVGNIVEITDDAQETVFFANTQVSPDRTFSYDSLYRLVSATGREKVGQSQSTAFYADYAGGMGGIPDAGNPALRRYTQSYTYDAAGNILETKHQQGSGGTVLWRRGYALESGNNQLLSTSLPGDDPDDPATHSDTYAYDARGAMVFLPHLKTGVSQNLTRDFRDQLRKADLDSASNVAWYSYDAAGQRVRKVWDKGSIVEERIYVGGYEVWRKKDGAGTVQEERQTLHVMDDERRIAMVETLTITGGSVVGTPTARVRYQLGDHLGTALLEVDGDGGVISYEEYHPYGTTAWWAEDSAIQVSRKRYRYTGKEKDEETGLSYHGHRYYVPWLGRWGSADPAGLVDGGNRWGHVGGRPVGSGDPSGLSTVSHHWQSEEGRAFLAAAQASGHLPEDPAELKHTLQMLMVTNRAGEFRSSIRFQSGDDSVYLTGLTPMGVAGLEDTSFEQVLAGEYYEGERTWEGFFGEVALGFTPAGWAADIRDASAHAGNLGSDPYAYAGLIGAVVGFVPGVGDAVKKPVKFAGRFVTELAQPSLRISREAAERIRTGKVQRFFSLSGEAGTSDAPDFLVGPGGNAVPTSQSRMTEGFEAAGFPAKPTRSPDTEYTLPDGRSVRAMEPSGQAPRRASFENANGQPVDVDGQTVQPPRGLTKSERKAYVRERTHVEQTK